MEFKVGPKYISSAIYNFGSMVSYLTNLTSTRMRNMFSSLSKGSTQDESSLKSLTVCPVALRTKRVVGQSERKRP